MSIAATAGTKPPEVIGQPDAGGPLQPFLFRVAERFGLPVVVLLLVLWWARTDVVQPLLDAHFVVIDKIVRGQEQHSTEMREVGKKLDRLIEIAGQK